MSGESAASLMRCACVTMHTGSWTARHTRQLASAFECALMGVWSQVSHEPRHALAGKRHACIDDGVHLFPRGLLQQSSVYDAMQCGSGSLNTCAAHLPTALCEQHALQVLLSARSASTCPPPKPAFLLQRFPSFFPWAARCSARELQVWRAFSSIRRRRSARSCRVSRKRAPSRQPAAAPAGMWRHLQSSRASRCRQERMIMAVVAEHAPAVAAARLGLCR